MLQSTVPKELRDKAHPRRMLESHPEGEIKQPLEVDGGR